IARPSLRLQKSGPAQTLLYDALTFRLQVTNTGAGDVTDLVLTDLLPDGLEHSSHSNKLTWNLGSLPAGPTRAVEYQVIAKAVGRLCNHASASAAGGIQENAESCVIVAEANMSLGKTGPRVQYLNFPVAYRITVTNTGSSPLAQVVITDPVPAQARFV